MASSDLQSDKLPEKRTPMFNGNFMILNHEIKSNSKSSVESPSFLELGYGDDRKTFSGFHRFEVSRQGGGKEEEGGAVLQYSSISCNPAEDRRIFPWVTAGTIVWFHNFYALCLFRDGVREVLRRDGA